MNDIHTFRKEVVALFGRPVDENPTVVMMDAGFANLALDWRYVTLEVAPQGLPSAVAGARAMGFRGFNCTIPHKQAVLPLLDEIAPAAALIGAVNCVTNEKGRLIGHNTDGQGLIAALRSRRSLDGVSVTLIGAGGAARAIAVDLALAGASSFTIVNRSEKPAAELASLLLGKVTGKIERPLAVRTEKLTGVPVKLEETDILINATSVGLAPNVNAELPIDLSGLHDRMLVADVIPNPAQTKLIQAARAAGCSVVDGLEMLVGQGVIGLHIWSGAQADQAAMRRALTLEFS